MPDGLEAIAPRRAGVGAGVVRRYLPTSARRLVGPWCFLDVFGADGGVDASVGPHPHIGIQTATWLVGGTSTHRDSIGSFAPVDPGSLALMTAGRGIAHAEESPPGHPAHGAQLWIALPGEARDADPAFALHVDLPHSGDEAARVVVFAGEMLGARAPGRFFTPIVGAELDLTPGASTQLRLEMGFEHAFVALHGSFALDGTSEGGDLVYLPPGRTCVDLATDEGTTALVLGGEPFAEQIVMWWNFVARDEAEIAAARDDWEHHRRFGEVEGSALERVSAPGMPPGHLRPRSSHRSSAGDR